MLSTTEPAAEPIMPPIAAPERPRIVPPICPPMAVPTAPRTSDAMGQALPLGLGKRKTKATRRRHASVSACSTTPIRS